MAGNSAKSITILIKHQGAASNLHRLLRSIDSQSAQIDLEMIVFNADKSNLTSILELHAQQNCKVLETSSRDIILDIKQVIDGITSEWVLVAESDYLFGKDLLAQINAEKIAANLLLYPEFCVHYSGASGLRIFNKKTDTAAIFTGNIFENFILGSTELVKDLFTQISVSGRDLYWQLYCAAFVKDIEIKSLKDAVVFKKVPNSFDLGPSDLQLGYIKTGLFTDTELLKKIVSNVKTLGKAAKLVMGLKNYLTGRVNVKIFAKSLIQDEVTELVSSRLLNAKTPLYLQWQAANFIDPLLFPEKRVLQTLKVIKSNSGELANHYLKLLSLLPETNKVVILVPNIKVGGAYRATKSYLKVLLTKYAPQEIILIATDTLEDCEAKLKDLEIPVINLRVLCPGLHEVSYIYLLLNLLVQTEPRLVHNINSVVAYQLFAKFGQELAKYSKLFLTHFAINYSDEGKRVGAMLEYLPYFYDSLTAISTDNVTVVNEIEQILGLSKIKYHVHLLPVALNRQTVTKKIAGASVKVLWASRIDLQKDIPTLIKIVSYYQDRAVSFEIAGVVEDNSSEEHQQLLKLKNVSYLGGFTSISDLPIAGADLFLYTSISDGIPLVLLEIMAQGVIPIIASKAGAIPEMLLHNNISNGVVCANFEDFIQAIDHYKNDSSCYKELVENAYQYVSQFHNQEKFAQDVANFNGYLD